MNETEIDRMVATLDGDGSGYQKMLDDAVKQTDSATKAIEKQGSMIESIGASLKSYAGTILQAVGGLGIKSFLSSSLHEFEESEMGMIRLEAAIKSNGGDVEELSKKYSEFAGQMQETTIYSDDMVISLLKQAETFQLSGDAAISATKDAINLAAATGSSANQMMRLTAAMEKGDIKGAMMFSRLIPQLRGVKDEAEFVDRYNKLLATGMETVEKEAGTLGGMLKIVANLWSDVKEAIGETVSESLKPVVDIIRKGVGWFNSLNKTTKAFVTTVAMVTTGVLGLTVAIKAAGIVFNLLFGGVGIWIGLFSVVVGLVAGLTVSLGGLGGVFEGIRRRAEQAWEWLRPARERVAKLWDDLQAWATRAWNVVETKATQAWEWTRPIRQALQSFFEFLVDTGAKGWDYLVKIATDAWDWIVEKAEAAWEAIFGTVEVNWTKISRSIQAGIIFIEYSLRNLDKVFEIAWTRAALGLVQFEEGVKFFFLTTIPELLDWFAEEWPNVIIDAIDMSMKYIENRFSNIATLFENLLAILSGEKSITGLFDGLVNELDGVESRFTKLPQLTERGMSDVEKILKQDLDGLEKDFMDGFEEFYRNKMNEFAMDDVPWAVWEDESDDSGRKAMDNFTDAAAKEAQKADAVLAGSFKAFERIGDYLDNLYGEKTGKGGKGKSPLDMVDEFDNRMVQKGGGGGDSAPRQAGKMSKSDELLAGIHKTLIFIANKPPQYLVSTDLEG